MTFEELLDQAIVMLQRRGRITYRALQRQCALDEDALNDLRDELLYAHPEVHDDAGRGEEAWQHAHQVEGLARQQKERGNEALALHQPGVVHAHAAPPEAEHAAAHYRQALALAEALGMRPLVAHCHRGLGTLYAKARRQEQARADLSAAIALYRAMDMTFWLPEAEAALAQVEGR